MKKIIYLLLITFVFYSCDPEVCAEYKIKNSTNLDLTLILVESSSSRKTIEINKQSEINFVESSCDIGGAPLLYLSNYDSISIKSSSNELLKIFQENTLGKNIYNVDKYWIIKKTSKHHYVFTYEISDTDLE
ncbi:hypothetical protein [Wenyingzhuangia sp. IMCC45467]